MIKVITNLWKRQKTKNRVYLDYASITPVDSNVASYVWRLQKEFWKNPSSIHSGGRNSKNVLREARNTVAKLLNARHDSSREEEIIFTSSGTEANNIAIFGVIRAWSSKRRPHIITSTIEHASVLEVFDSLESEGVLVTKIAPEENGIIDPKKIESALTPDTALVSIMLANNEIGTIQPIAQISKIIRNYREKRNEIEGDGSKQGVINYPYFHTDASQGVLYLDIRRDKLGVDLMTIDSIKMYGPRGVGVLYVRHGVEIAPIIMGGGQQKLRPGTENLPAIAGMSLALTDAFLKREGEFARLKVLQDYLIHELDKKFNGKFMLNGDRNNRLPNNVHICIPGIDAEFAVIQLDNLGIECSSTSACSTHKDVSGSYVVESLYTKGNTKRCSESSLRITFGRETKKSHIDKLLKALTHVIQ